MEILLNQCKHEMLLVKSEYSVLKGCIGKLSRILDNINKQPVQVEEPVRDEAVTQQQPTAAQLKRRYWSSIDSKFDNGLLNKLRSINKLQKDLQVILKPLNKSLDDSQPVLYSSTSDKTLNKPSNSDAVDIVKPKRAKPPKLANQPPYNRTINTDLINTQEESLFDVNQFWLLHTSSTSNTSTAATTGPRPPSAARPSSNRMKMKTINENTNSISLNYVNLSTLTTNRLLPQTNANTTSANNVLPTLRKLKSASRFADLSRTHSFNNRS